MSRKVLFPPNETPSPDGIRAGGWWHDADDGGRVVCDLCPRACRLGPDDRGFCFVRQNLGGRMVSTTYGRSTGFCIDPIEKKPLNQFYPGSSVLSFGTAGCNLGCKFCQNWTSSKSREVDAFCDLADPESIAAAAQRHHCRSVAFTYNDPIVWAEYAIDTARACRAVGVKTVAVTSGYIAPAAREAFYAVMDAANVDLKGFREEFYWKLTSGHLAPVLDTLRWLVHETDVWLEITNLVIPGANDSDDEIRRMCQWIAEELGPDVPLHFSAFHPDFRMRDRGATPPATLARACQFARDAGLRYVYTGNVSDSARQSTYCPGCGRLVIERNGYTLGEYGLEQDRCRSCGARIAGRFDASPGDWGSRRLPIRIAAPARPKPSPPLSAGESRMESPSPQESVQQTWQRPKLTVEQEAAIFRTAGRRVAAAVRCHAPEPSEPQLSPIAEMPLLGAFVTLKRAGQLRSCCGFLGQSVPLAQALEHASVRAAKDDPRFPPIVPAELGQLHMDVWLLWGLEPVHERGEARVRAVEIGKHGLQISRGAARGLLLPGVAVEHHLDAREFLCHVCLKAGLPPEAWRDDDTVLMRFEGYAIEGPLDPGPAPVEETCFGGPRPAEVAALAEFARQNLASLAAGATPSFYLSGGFDGGVLGLSMSVRLPSSAETISCSRLNFLSEMPLQASLFEMVRTLNSALSSRRLAPQAFIALRVGLSVFWNATLQGTVAEPKLEGIDPHRRAVVVSDRPRWSLAHDPEKTPDELLKLAVEQSRLPDESEAQVYSVAVATNEPRLVASNVPRPQAGPDERAPVVAGRFYPGDPRELDTMLDEFLTPQSPREAWAAALVPHAGWIYSGRLAASVFGRVQFPSRVIVIAPKHHAQGADWAVAPHRVWRLPSGSLESDPELAQRLASSVAGLELDALAHQAEHAIEVQLPFLARLAPQAKVVGIVIGRGDLPQLQRFAEQLAGALRDLPERPLLVVSSDMSHEQNRSSNEVYARQMDRMAMDAMKTLDPAQLYNTVATKGITMCGFRPAVLAMETLRRLDSLHRCEEVGYATSADSPSGRPDYVVGYAGMLFA